MSRHVANVILLLTLNGCPNSGEETTPPAGAAGRQISDSAFAQVQTRGHVAMGVDQYTSFHQFRPTPDGGLISLQRDPADSAGVARIRAHMSAIADAFERGDFTLPGFVHDRNVPGTPVMMSRKSRIRYTARELAGGGQVRIQSSDPVAIRAIHEFLAFQRHDHRSEGHEAAQ